MSAIELPDLIWTDCNFDPVQPRSTNRMEGRRTEAQSFGTPYWAATYQASWLDEVGMGLMDAFMMRAGDGGEVFLAYDPSRPRPIAMDQKEPLSGTKAGGGSFDGSGAVQGFTGNTVIHIGGLPADFIFSPGDYIELRMSALKRSLHRVVAAAVSDEDGFATLTVRYPIDRQHFTTSATVHLEKPCCTMQIDPGSYSGSKAWSARNPSFSATEVFLS